MRRRFWLTPIAAVICVLVLIANLYVFFTREWEASFVPTTYATLYYPLDVPTIREWKVVSRDSIQLDLACLTNVGEWKVLTDGGRPQVAHGMKPAFRIDTTHAQLHTYELMPLPAGVCPGLTITIRCYLREFYASLGMQHDDVYIVRSSVACGKFEQYSVADWVDDYSYAGEKNLIDAQRVLKDDMGILHTDSSLVKIQKIVPYLKKKLQGSGGVPKDDERWMDPWTLYTEMVAGTAKGWCTQNAQVFVFWANRAGVPTRFVFTARTQDNTIVYTGHSFAECYISEQNRWAFVDLQAGQIYVTDKRGEVLNAAELFHLSLHDSFDSTFARVYVNEGMQKLLGAPRADMVMTVPFALCNSNIHSEFSPHAIFKYRRPPNVEDVRDIYSGFYKDWTFLVGNLDRYLFKPPLAYSLYPTEGGETYLVRRVLFFALLASVLLWLGAVMMGRSRKKRQTSSAKGSEQLDGV
jgi:hypothetical protein